MRVTHECELQDAYLFLRMLQSQKPGSPKISELKREIRAFQNRAPRPEERRVYLGSDYDGCSYIEPLPESVKTEEQAEAYFEHFIERHCIPSQYDCTGQTFTVGHRVFRRQGCWWVYHIVGLDV